jgi:lipid-A-disaccharide synthase
MNEKNLMIVAGEVSGDLHGSFLIKELKKLDPKLNIFGIGGDRMISEGMNVNYHISNMAFLGFVEVIRHIPFIKKVQKELLEIIKENKIKVVVLIDYPGFNLNFAKKLKELNIKVVYYISPQIWAWGKGRIKKIKAYVDKMIVVFPFEEKIFKDENINVDFVGHPLLDVLKNYKFLSKEELYEKFNLDEEKEILLLLPGSRKHEVQTILPEMIKAAGKLSEEFNFQIIVSASPNIGVDFFSNVIDIKSFKIIRGYTYDLMKNSIFGIIKSGTSTLEAAIFELPMVIVYKTSHLTYMIGKSLIKLKKIGMANIIAGENVVPELIQNNLTESKIYSEAEKILLDKDLYAGIKNKLAGVKEKLGNEGASQKAAELIYGIMNEA